MMPSSLVKDHGLAMNNIDFMIHNEVLNNEENQSLFVETERQSVTYATNSVAYATSTFNTNFSNSESVLGEVDDSDPNMHHNPCANALQQQIPMPPYAAQHAQKNRNIREDICDDMPIQDHFDVSEEPLEIRGNLPDKGDEEQIRPEAVVVIKSLFMSVASEVAQKVVRDFSAEIHRNIMTSLDIDMEELVLHPSLENCLQQIMDVTEAVKKRVVTDAALRNQEMESNVTAKRKGTPKKRANAKAGGGGGEDWLPPAKPVRKRRKNDNEDGENENDKRSAPSPIHISWTKCPEGSQVDVKEISWNPFHKGHRVSYHNPLINTQVTRYFSSRRYKGKPQSLAAANEFVQNLKLASVPNDDEDFMDPQTT